MSDRSFPLRDLARFGDRPALIAAERTVGYAELAALIEAAASRRPDARQLAFVEVHNSVPAIVEYLACLERGDPVFPFAADQSGIDALVERYRPGLVIAANSGGMAIHAHADPTSAFAPELALLLSTSGTTGSPKMVKLSAGNIGSNALAIAEYLGLTDSDRAMTSLKLNYSFGLSVLHSHLAVGAAVILTEASVIDPAFWALAGACGATSFSGVPYSFEMLARGGGDWAALPSLRHVAQAGGRLAPALVEQMAALGERHDWRFFVMYGQTEAAPRMAYLPPELARQYPGHIGRAIPGGAFALIGRDGAELAGEGEGELAYRGPNVMIGYAENAADLATTAAPERLLTGDIARRDANGLYRIVGRAARFVKPFGLRVNLDDVEADARVWLDDAVATGTDELIVVATTGAATAATAAQHGLAEGYGLPPHAVRVLALDAIPRLSNGKPDLAAIDRAAGPGATAATHRRSPLSVVVSPEFYRQVVRETLAILGLGAPRWHSVAGIFAMFASGTEVADDARFVDLNADSLSFVHTALALEEYLGHAPEGWEMMTVAALEEGKRHASVV